MSFILLCFVFIEHLRQIPRTPPDLIRSCLVGPPSSSITSQDSDIFTLPVATSTNSLGHKRTSSWDTPHNNTPNPDPAPSSQLASATPKTQPCTPISRSLSLLLPYTSKNLAQKASGELDPPRAKPTAFPLTRVMADVPFKRESDLSSKRSCSTCYPTPPIHTHMLVYCLYEPHVVFKDTSVSVRQAG